MLMHFLSINLPYMIEIDDQRQLTVFNREYQPIGIPTKSDTKPEPHPPVAYKGLTQNLLIQLAGGDEKRMRRDDDGNIVQVWLYYDGNNPIYFPDRWNEYADKLKLLSRLERKR